MLDFCVHSHICIYYVDHSLLFSELPASSAWVSGPGVMGEGSGGTGLWIAPSLPPAVAIVLERMEGLLVSRSTETRARFVSR